MCHDGCHFTFSFNFNSFSLKLFLKKSDKKRNVNVVIGLSPIVFGFGKKKRHDFSNEVEKRIKK